MLEPGAVGRVDTRAGRAGGQGGRAGRAGARTGRAGGSLPRSARAAHAQRMPHAPPQELPPISRSEFDSLGTRTGPAARAERGGLCCVVNSSPGRRCLRSMARGLLHGIVAVAASAHSPVPPPLTVVPPPPLPPAPDDGGFSPLPAPRPPSTELGRALLGSQHDGRQLAHSTTIVGSGSIVGSVTSASLLDYVRATLRIASSTAPRLVARPPPKAFSCPPALAHSLALACCAHSLMASP